jgi:hypothetical protein
LTHFILAALLAPSFANAAAQVVKDASMRAAVSTHACGGEAHLTHERRQA